MQCHCQYITSQKEKREKKKIYKFQKEKNVDKTNNT